eukprot:gnl/MRDRNA2_/MRDRNA2_84342_c0_seq1.p1 gnl/MRDRNA2_/MRDRNA2_84342_c0~~gnl/MRDRNA2_/MRDRNA2_84342_c0_seq1.p1  ORF type:complete len:242 (+),score=56.20 gnl/MRDRNA2_/MRDRNA2_84342_c0_seq1:83-808(+)
MSMPPHVQGNRQQTSAHNEESIMKLEMKPLRKLEPAPSSQRSPFTRSESNKESCLGGDRHLKSAGTLNDVKWEVPEDLSAKIRNAYAINDYRLFGELVGNLRVKLSKRYSAGNLNMARIVQEILGLQDSPGNQEAAEEKPEIQCKQYSMACPMDTKSNQNLKTWVIENEYDADWSAVHTQRDPATPNKTKKKKKQKQIIKDQGEHDWGDPPLSSGYHQTKKMMMKRNGEIDWGDPFDHGGC